MKTEFLTPVITVFNDQKKPDLEKNGKVYDFLIENGVDGILVLGSTGEFYAMHDEDKKALIDYSIQHINHRVKVFIGTGGCNLEDTISLSNYAIEKGADGVMVISPYYFPHTQQDLESWYDAIANNVKGNIYIYNFPDRTGYSMTPETFDHLLTKHSNIVGMKDSVGVWSHTRDILAMVNQKHPNTFVYSGFDEYLVHNHLSGGSGCIGALSNVYPEICSSFAKAINTNDMPNIEKYQKIIDRLMAIYDIHQPFIPTLKIAMVLRGLDIYEDSLAPLANLTDKEISSLKALMNEIEKDF